MPGQQQAAPVRSDYPATMQFHALAHGQAMNPQKLVQGVFQGVQRQLGGEIFSRHFDTPGFESRPAKPASNSKSHLWSLTRKSLSCASASNSGPWFDVTPSEIPPIRAAMRFESPGAHKLFDWERSFIFWSGAKGAPAAGRHTTAGSRWPGGLRNLAVP